MATHSSEHPDWPAAMDQQTASAYCGIGVELFKRMCPVKPITFTASPKGARYLRVRIDEWLASMDPNVEYTPRRRFGENIGDGKGEIRRASHR